MIRRPGNQCSKLRRKIKWRGHEILRIEAFSDAVFAFAITLLVISLEVPRTFEELITGMQGITGFAVCFAMLFLIWYEQYIFFRMFFLKDSFTILLNAILLFVVLCYVYPLKFLFSLLTEGNHFKQDGQVFEKISSYEQIRLLMIIYGIGFCLVYFVFLLLYLNAWTKRKDINLTAIEQFYTKSELYKQVLLISIGLLSVVGAYFLPDQFSVKVGMIYIIIGPAIFVFFRFRKRMLNRKFSKDQLHLHDKWLLETDQ